VSAYPNQPRSRGGWPEQPPEYTRGQEPGYGPGDYGRDHFEGGRYEPDGYDQDRYEQGGYDQDRYGYDGYGPDSYGQGVPDDYFEGRHYPGNDRQRPRRRKRRGRGLIVLLVIVIILGGAFYFGDGYARSYAEKTVASKLEAQGFPGTPTVTIEGWPFLTQVAERDVKTVTITSGPSTKDKLEISGIHATASGVHITSGFNGATIDSITGDAQVPFSSLSSAMGVSNALNSALGNSGLPASELGLGTSATLSADPSAGTNAVKVTDGSLATTAKITTASGNTIAVQPAGISIAGFPVQLPGFTLRMPDLPMGLTTSGVSVNNQGISIAVSAHDVSLSA
jgi:hypothetical protein